MAHQKEAGVFATVVALADTVSDNRAVKLKAQDYGSAARSGQVAAVNTEGQRTWRRTAVSGGMVSVTPAVVSCRACRLTGNEEAWPVPPEPEGSSVAFVTEGRG